jgi:hypothetical protein
MCMRLHLGGRILPDYLNHHLRNHMTCEIVTARLPSEVLWQLAHQPVPLVICDDTVLVPSARQAGSV